ncbi:hypothetical protein ACFW04_012295 [Cataglyphis niger]
MTSYITLKYPELLRDARILLGTVRKVHANDVEPGRYYHLGLNYCMKKLAKISQYSFRNFQIIEIVINIDGLPLSKSSGSQVYHILCSLVINYSNVGIIGIYHGYEKPTNANKCLQSFEKEIQYLTTHGVTVNGIIYPFKIKTFVFDAPAQSFIKYTKVHSGYYSCTKCEIKGEYYLNRVCFSYSEISNLRTDKKFRLKSQLNHHIGASILELIPNIDMVFDFPSDPMHLLFGEKRPIILKSILSHDQYLHFITIHVAATTLSSSKYIELYFNYVKLLLQYYVEEFIILYSKDSASHNTHNLLHFCDDNYMQSIFKMICKNDKPLEQIVCRISEQNNYMNPNLNIRHVLNKPHILNPHFNGSLINCHNYNQFSKVVYEKFILTNKEPDNCCCLMDGSIIVILNFASNIKNTIIVGNKYKALQDLYTKPCKSSKLNIYKVCNLGNLQT